jgi:hypothetical protein
MLPNGSTNLVSVSEDDIQQAREQGREAAETVLDSHAPTDPLLRVAWADGYGQVDVLRDAVMRARADGATWKQLGEVLGMHFRTVQSKFGQPDRHRRYEARKRGES